MSNLKLDANELICEMDSQTQRTDLCLSGGKRVAEGWIGSLGLRHACRCVLSHIRLFAIPWTAAHQASWFFTLSWSLLKVMSIESVMPSNLLILCHLLLLLPSIVPSTRVFSNESALCIRWPKHWSFSFNISPSNEHPGLIAFRWTGWMSLQSKGLSRSFSNTTVQKHQFFSTQIFSQFNSHIHTWALEKS